MTRHRRKRIRRAQRQARRSTDVELTVEEQREQWQAVWVDEEVEVKP